MQRKAAVLPLSFVLAGACRGEAPQTTAPAASETAAGALAPTLPTPGATGSAASALTTSAAPVTVRAKGELPGETIDYPYDASDVGDPSRAYTGRAFLPDRARSATAPLPLVVFFHGLNRELIEHRWMGGGNEGDVRRIVGDLVERGAVPPLVLAGPGSVKPAAVSGGASFPTFDLDGFVGLTEKAVAPTRIDRARVAVLGHSGAGCSAQGGIVSATRSKLAPLAIVSIDTCMGGALAEALGRAGPKTHVVVTWQTASWDRSFDHFRRVFVKEVHASPPEPGVLRELDALPNLPRAHDATVKQTFDKWLPRILGDGASAAP